ncbi:MAG TPA: hypothetical protein VJO16_04010 [Candidatus Acidoferrum sp.]|nr:hypothetical protein [Candidatus Acidoferrum sp.]
MEDTINAVLAFGAFISPLTMATILALMKRFQAASAHIYLALAFVFAFDFTFLGYLLAAVLATHGVKGFGQGLLATFRILFLMGIFGFLIRGFAAGIRFLWK